jgi:hypothetical protein
MSSTYLPLAQWLTVLSGIAGFVRRSKVGILISLSSLNPGCGGDGKRHYAVACRQGEDGTEFSSFPLSWAWPERNGVRPDHATPPASVTFASEGARWFPGRVRGRSHQTTPASTSRPRNRAHIKQIWIETAHIGREKRNDRRDGEDAERWLRHQRSPPCTFARLGNLLDRSRTRKQFCSAC